MGIVAVYAILRQGIAKNQLSALEECSGTSMALIRECAARNGCRGVEIRLGLRLFISTMASISFLSVLSDQVGHSWQLGIRHRQALKSDREQFSGKD